MMNSDQNPEIKRAQHEASRAPHLRNYLFIFLFALMVVGLMWQWYDNRNQIRSLEQTLGKRLSEVDVQNRESHMIAADSKNSLREVETKLRVLENKVLESQNQQVALEALYQELSRNRDEWALADIEQILLIASQQLELAGNVSAAIVALQIVDNRLQRFDRPQLLKLRKAVNDDIDHLRRLPVPDTDGIIFRLDNIAASIETLPLAMEVRPREETVSNTRASAGENMWVRLTREIWQEMKQIVRIQSLDKPEVPLLSPEQVFFLRENVRLRLLSARLALFAHDEKSFKADLSAVQDWLKRYFDANNTSVLNTIVVIRELNDSNIDIEIPDISGSLDATRNYRLSRGRSPS